MKKDCPPLSHDWFPQPLPGNVGLGERSWCYSSFSCLHYRSERSCGLRIGHDTGIYHGTFFELGPEAEVVIGNYCTLVGAIINTNGQIEIGDYSFLAHEVVLADSFASFPEDIPVASPLPSSSSRASDTPCEFSIRIGPKSWIGARAVLLRGADIGEGAVVGAAAVIDFAVPAFAVVAGNPARVVGSVRAESSDPLETDVQSAQAKGKTWDNAFSSSVDTLSPPDCSP